MSKRELTGVRPTFLFVDMPEIEVVQNLSIFISGVYGRPPPPSHAP